MEENNIENYREQLKQICDICPAFRKKKCKDHSRLCFHKKQLFLIAKKEFKKRNKQNLDHTK